MKKLIKSLLCLTLLAFGQDAWAQTTVTTAAELVDAVTVDNADIQLDANIQLSSYLNIDAKTVTIDLNGHKLYREIAGGHASDGHVIYVHNNAHLTLNNSTGTGSIEGGKANNGGAIFIEPGSTVNATGITFQNNSAGEHAGAIWNAGSLTLTNCTISSNTAGDVGGIYNAVVDGVHCGTASLTNCTFTGNSSSSSAGALGNAEGATSMTLHSCTITGNTAGTNGGGIWNGGTLTITGGNITGNTATTNGGGIYHLYGTLNMNGNPVVLRNTGNSKANNVYLSSSKVITVTGAFTEGTSIGIKPASTSQTMTSGYSSYNSGVDPATYFYADDDYYFPTLSSNEVKQSIPAISYIDANGNTQTHTNCHKLSYLCYSGGTEMGMPYNTDWYVVDEDLTFDSRLFSQCNIHLILADGHTLTAHKGIDVSASLSKSLTIYGQSAQTGTIIVDNPNAYFAGIGGGIDPDELTEDDPNGYFNSPITINGGIIDVKGGVYAAGIGASCQAPQHSLEMPITINGGSVTATGGNWAAGIGGGRHSSVYPININGGTVHATGGTGCVGIGRGAVDANETEITSIINLNWTSTTDNYYSTGYDGTVTVADGKAFVTSDGSVSGLTGTLTDNQKKAINDKTIVPSELYNIHVGTLESGTVTAPATAYSGAKVTLTVTPDAEFSCTNLTVTGETSGNEITLTQTGDNTYKFTMPTENVNVSAEFKTPVNYLDLNGIEQSELVKVIDGNTTTLSDGWYAVTSNVTNNNRIQAEGDVNIILCDGATMTSKGIDTYSNKHLTFWGQSAGTGTWEVTSPDAYEDGIGNSMGAGYISINGGVVRSQGADYRYGIRGQSITIHGGSVWANNYGCDVTLERFFSINSSNTVYEPGVFDFDNSTSIDDKTLTATGKVFHTEGEWSNTDNWYKGELPGRNDYVAIRASVTIPAGCVAQAYKANLGNNATLTIADGGQLIYTFYNSNVISSEQFLLATVEKNITGAENWTTASNGWYFIAAPMYFNLDPSDVTNMLTGDYDLYKYVADNMVEGESKPWYNYRQHTFNLEKKVGYLYANANSQTLRFVGRVNPYGGAYNYNVVTLEKTGWNLIGNPFTCKVTVNHDFAELNNGSAVDYKTSGNAIMPCAGIAVYGNAGDQVTFSIVEPDQAPVPSNGSLNIAVAQQATDRGTATIIDNAIVSFNEGSELPKFHFMEQAANIYFPKANEEYAVVGTNAQGEMPVNFKASKNGEYTINVNAENVEMNYLHLVDNLTGADIDLLATPSYSFNAKTDDYASRFKLVFSAVDNDNDDKNFAFISNGNIIVNGTGTVQVIDVTGRVLATHNANSHISINDLAAGVYVLRLVNGENVKTQKIVIR